MIRLDSFFGNVGLFGLALVAAAHNCVLAEDWVYRTKFDTFDNVETSTAVLRGHKTGEYLEIVRRGKDGLTVFFAAKDFECYPHCYVQIKFDGNSPEVFKARAPDLLSYVIVIDDQKRFQQLSANAKTIILRAARWRETSDLAFSLDSSFDPKRWDDARARQARELACRENAVNQDYATCMTRQGQAAER